MSDVIKQRQRVEVLAEQLRRNGGSGGGSGEGYTKAEADAKFQTKADMADYLEEQTGGYFIVNNVRVYVGATQPVDAPTGSIWIGG